MTAARSILLTSEVARRLGVSAAYVRKLADAGRLPSQRASGGVRLFLEADVTAFAVKQAALREPVLICEGEGNALH